MQGNLASSRAPCIRTKKKQEQARGKIVGVTLILFFLKQSSHVNYWQPPYSLHYVLQVAKTKNSFFPFQQEATIKS